MDWTNSGWSPMTGFCEQGDENSNSKKTYFHMNWITWDLDHVPDNQIWDGWHHRNWCNIFWYFEFNASAIIIYLAYVTSARMRAQHKFSTLRLMNGMSKLNSSPVFSFRNIHLYFT
jgi:hypothetical protein